MTWRMISVLALAACGGGDDGAGAPPLTTGQSATLTLGSAVGTDTDSSGTDSATEPTSTATDTAAEEDSATCGNFTVLMGALIDGGAAASLPFECRIKFHGEGQVDVATGEDLGGYLFQLSGFVIDEYPRSFVIESDQITTVDCGTVGYVVAQCDVDGDGSFTDDNVGGYYPDLPLQPVTIPAAGIYIRIEAL